MVMEKGRLKPNWEQEKRVSEEVTARLRPEKMNWKNKNIISDLMVLVENSIRTKQNQKQIF